MRYAMRFGKRKRDQGGRPAERTEQGEGSVGRVLNAAWP